MLLTIFGLVYIIIISETLLFSSIKAHTFEIIADCPETDPDQIPIPINAKTYQLLSICLGQNELVEKKEFTPYEITGLKIMKLENEKKQICTYTLENKTTVVPVTIKTKRGQIVCDHYSEFQIKITAYCDANLSPLRKMPKPINAKAMELYKVCLDNNGIGGHKIRVNKVVGTEREDKKYICTYTFEREKDLSKKGEDGEEECVNYSEIDEEKKMMMKQNAKVGRKNRKEMKKKGSHRESDRESEMMDEESDEESEIQDEESDEE